MSEFSEQPQRVVTGDPKPGVQAGGETGRLGFLRSVLNRVLENRGISGEHQESSQDLKSRLEKRLENWHVWINQQQIRAEAVEKPEKLSLRKHWDQFKDEVLGSSDGPSRDSFHESLEQTRREFWELASMSLGHGDRILTSLRLRLGGPRQNDGGTRGR